MYRSAQQGVALLTILVMVALATILAATIAKRQAYTAENTGYLMRQNQSLLYAKSAEAFFMELLQLDAENAGNVDHLQETWALPMPAFPVENGSISGVLQDESGKFNLNNLVKADGTPNEAAKLWFERLLQRVGLPTELSQAVIDWQDVNQEVAGAMGAESSYYQGLNPPYSAPNQIFHNIAELKQVRGFEGKKYDLIAPYISALPEVSKLNINTAVPLVLASLDQKLDILEVDSALQQKKQNLEYFQQVADLWVLSPFQQVDPPQQAALNELLDVKSNYFKAQIDVVLDGRKRQLRSWMLRKDRKVVVYYRDLVPFE